MNEIANTCHHCGAPATKLCDFHFGLVIGGFGREGKIEANRWHAVMSMETEKQFYTCDRPLCDVCATVTGRVFFCAGKDSYQDTYDACKDHANDKSDAYPLTSKEAGEIQNRLHLRLTPPRGKATLVKA